MSTQIKQKSKKNNRVSGLFSSKVCTVLFLLISMRLSSSFGYDASKLSLSDTYQVLPEASQKKDISEFGKLLSERLKGVFGEIVVLVNKGKLNIQSNKSQFLDIDGHEDRYFIDILAKSDIIQGAGNQKFYPDNYMRAGDFLKILVNTYRQKVGYDLATTNGLANEVYLNYSKNEQLQTYINTAYNLGFLNNISEDYLKDYDFDKIITTREISKIFDNINKQYPGLISRVSLDISDLKTKRGECSKYIVQAFQIGQNNIIQEQYPLSANTQKTEKSLIKGIALAIKDYYLKS